MKILLAYNHRSELSDKLLEFTKRYAEAFNASVDVLTSGERTSTEKQLPYVEEAEQALARVEEFFTQAGITCCSHLILRGMSPGEDIVSFARENGTDMIMVGVDQQSRVGKFFMGSLTQHVVLKAPCPVLTISPGELEADVLLGTTSMY